jgi:hypothetical protein
MEMQMIRNRKILLALIIFAGIIVSPYFLFAGTDTPWTFKLTSETVRLTNGPFYLMTAADLNHNGLKEIIVADFGMFGDEQRGRERMLNPRYNLWLLEWDSKKLSVKWRKNWDLSKIEGDRERDKRFVAWEARQLIVWPIGDQVIVETIPPYLGLEWIKDKYVLREQQGYNQEKPLVGSWALPWLTDSCHLSFSGKKSAEQHPRECLLGIREFKPGEKPKIVTVFEEEVQKKEYRQTLRVRKFETGSPIEWEAPSPKRFAWWGMNRVFVDQLNWRSDQLLLFELGARALEAYPPPYSWSLLQPEENGPGYRVNTIAAKDPLGLDTYDLPNVYLRRTQSKETWEYWGYYAGKGYDGYAITSIRKVTLKPDGSAFVQEDLHFPWNDQFLGVGYFDLQDIDNDGLDELILFEQTGKRTISEQAESVQYSNTKNYIRVLKWNGKEYQTMWISPVYVERGAKFLVEDLKNTGQKQLVVMTGRGTIQIWERQ